jgi:glycosyltransferase 2 family protein
VVQGKGAHLNRGRLRLTALLLLTALTAAAAFAFADNWGGWAESVRLHSWNIEPVTLVISALLLFLSLVMSPLGWALTAREMGSAATRRELFAAWYASQLGRYIPGKVWLFAGRAGYLRSKGMTTARAAATTFYELFFSAASVGLVTLAAAVFSPLPAEGAAVRWAIILAGGALLFVPFLHPVQRTVASRKGISAESLPSASLSLKVTGVFAAIWLVRGYALYLLLEGTGIHDISIFRAIAAAPLSWLAGYIVVFVPGGLGIREAAAAAIAAPGSVAPAVVALGGQRLYMAAVEVILALAGSGGVLVSGRTDVDKR